MEKILKNKAEINNRIYNKPTSAITENGKRINYYDYIYSLKNPDCNEALKRLIGKIDMEKIKKEDLESDQDNVVEIKVKCTTHASETSDVFFKYIFHLTMFF